MKLKSLVLSPEHDIGIQSEDLWCLAEVRVTKRMKPRVEHEDGVIDVIKTFKERQHNGTGDEYFEFVNICEYNYEFKHLDEIFRYQ